MTIREEELDRLVSLLPKSNTERDRIIPLAYNGAGAIETVFGKGMIYSFWLDCIEGEIERYLRRKGLENGKGYSNTIHDFYIDTRCGRAPRKHLRSLQNELDLAINDDRKACSICGTATSKTAEQQHKDTLVSNKEWNKRNGKTSPEWRLSEKKLSNRNLTAQSYVCYFCYQNELATIPKSE